MKITPGAFGLLLVLGCFATVPVVAQNTDHHDPQTQQDQRHDQTGDLDRDHKDAQGHDQDRDHANVQTRDDSSYAGNTNFQQGWKDGQKHKHKNHKWANDTDRDAYEAGYKHGDRGEQWQNQKKDDDHRDDHQHQP